MAYHRAHLLALLSQQRTRASHCAFVPLWLLFLLAFSCSFLARADVFSAITFRTALSSRFADAWVDSGALRSGTAVGAASLLANAWAPAVANEGGVRASLVGGVRLSQWRAVAGGTCGAPALPPSVAALLAGGGSGVPCAAGASPLSSVPFGAGTGAWAPLGSSEAAAVAAAQVAGASAAVPASSLSRAFSAISRDVDSGAPLRALVDAGWADGSTVAIESAALGVLPSLSRWTYARARLDASSGGAFAGLATTCVLPVGEEAGEVRFALGLADMLIVVTAVVAAAAAFVRVRDFARRSDASFLSVARGVSAAARGNGRALFFALGVLVDVGLAISLCVSVGYASAATSAASALGAAAAAAAPGTALTPSTSDIGVLLLHARAQSACEASSAWASAVIAATFFVGLRSLGFLALSPRSGVVGVAISSVLGDVLHGGALIVALFFGFAVVAHGVFGAFAPSLSTLPSAAFALVKMLMFDYPLESMSAAGAAASAVFFTLYMLLVTHALLWAWLGVGLEAFSVARSELKENAAAAPTLVDDVAVGALGAWAWARAALAHVGSRGRPADAGPAPPWEMRKDVLRAQDMLRAAIERAPALDGAAAEYISVGDVAATLRLAPATVSVAFDVIKRTDDIAPAYVQALLGLLKPPPSSTTTSGADEGDRVALHTTTVAGGADFLPLSPGVESPPVAAASSSRFVTVRGVPVRTAAAPPLEMEVVSPRPN